MPDLPPTEFWFTGENLIVALNTGSAVFAVLAALFWFQSAGARVTFDPAKAGPNYEDFAITFPSRKGDEVDLMATLRKANRKSAFGAVSAALAAVLQASLFFIPALQKLGWLPMW